MDLTNGPMPPLKRLLMTGEAGAWVKEIENSEAGTPFDPIGWSIIPHQTSNQLSKVNEAKAAFISLLLLLASRPTKQPVIPCCQPDLTRIWMIAWYRTEWFLKIHRRSWIDCLHVSRSDDTDGHSESAIWIFRDIRISRTGWRGTSRQSKSWGCIVPKLPISWSLGDCQFPSAALSGSAPSPNWITHKRCESEE